jgi:VIT1/CCC1 family predicted Fe2+/Mn2+ transporter
MSELTPQDRTTKERLGVLTSTVRRLRVRRAPIVPHVGPTGGEQRMGGKSGALRAAIFGANDGLVSNLSLIMGVAGAGAENKVVILAGVAGLLAGAFSMGAGEYISVRVQREVFERLIHLEAHEIGTDPGFERQELTELYVRKGISPDLAGRLAEELMRDPEVALETHAREELGLDPQEGLGSPWAAAGSSFTTFSLGAIVPLIPFWFASGGGAVIASAILSVVALFAVGAGMSFLTGRSFLVSGLRMMAIGGAAAVITFGVGRLLDVSTGI